MKYHPEQKDNEIFMGNVYLDDRIYRDFQNKTSWKSNRYGDVAYSNVGAKLDYDGYYPWFITIDEVQSAITNLRWEIENIPCTCNQNKLETIAIYEQMINSRTVFNN
jgi:hypothetical protein